MATGHHVAVFLLVSCGILSAVIGSPTTRPKDDVKTSTTPVTPTGSDKEKPVSEKRSDEDIMFGNQQNKAAGMVDDLLSFGDDDNNDTSRHHQGGDHKMDNTLDYYDYLDENRALQLTDVDRDEPNLDQNPWDQEFYDFDDSNDIEPYELDRSTASNFRRKRTLPPPQAVLPAVAPLRTLKKRSYRSTLDDILGRSKRLRRRALARSKRQAPTDLVAILNALANNPELTAETRPLTIEDQEVMQFGRYPPAEQFGNFETDLNSSPLEPEVLAAISEAVANMDNSRDYYPQVARRSFSYPHDYRYGLGPGQRKRSRWGGSNKNGRWGEIAEPSSSQRYLEAEELERLYELATLLAESENGYRRRRRAA